MTDNAHTKIELFIAATDLCACNHYVENTTHKNIHVRGYGTSSTKNNIRTKVWLMIAVPFRWQIRLVV